MFCVKGPLYQVLQIALSSTFLTILLIRVSTANFPSDELYIYFQITDENVE